MKIEEIVFSNLKLPALKSSGKLVPPQFTLEKLVASIDIIPEYNPKNAEDAKSGNAKKTVEFTKKGEIPDDVKEKILSNFKKLLPPKTCEQYYLERMSKMQSEIDIINKMLDLIAKDPVVIAAILRDTGAKTIEDWADAKIKEVNERLAKNVTDYQNDLEKLATEKLDEALTSAISKANIKLKAKKLKILIIVIAKNFASIPKLMVAGEWSSIPKALLKGTLGAFFEAKKEWPSVKKSITLIKSECVQMEDRILKINQTITKANVEYVDGVPVEQKTFKKVFTAITGSMDLLLTSVGNVESESNKLQQLMLKRIGIMRKQVTDLNTLEQQLGDAAVSAEAKKKAKEKIAVLRGEMASRTDYADQINALLPAVEETSRSFSAAVAKRKKQLQKFDLFITKRLVDALDLAEKGFELWDDAEKKIDKGLEMIVKA